MSQATDQKANQLLSLFLRETLFTFQLLLGGGRAQEAAFSATSAAKFSFSSLFLLGLACTSPGTPGCSEFCPASVYGQSTRILAAI